MCNVSTIVRYARYNSVIAVADRVLILVGWSSAGVFAIAFVAQGQGYATRGARFCGSAGLEGMTTPLTHLQRYAWVGGRLLSRRFPGSPGHRNHQQRMDGVPVTPYQPSPLLCLRTRPMPWEGRQTSSTSYICCGQRGDGGIFFGWDVAVAASGPLNSSLHVITTRPPFFLFATIGGTTRFKSHYAFARYTRSLAHSLQSSSEHSLEAEETCGHEQGGGEEAPPP
jgi:hypothetical protein